MSLKLLGSISCAAAVAAVLLVLPPVPAADGAGKVVTIVSFARAILVLYDPETAKQRVDQLRRRDYEARQPGERMVVVGTLPSGALVVKERGKHYGVRRSHVITDVDAQTEKDCNKVAQGAVDSGANRAFGSDC